MRSPSRRGREARRGLGAASLLAFLALVGSGVACTHRAPGARSELAPTRGYLLISIDGLRADRTTPALDRLAVHGAVFLNAFSPHPDTLTAATSILTGLAPDEHGVRPPGLRLSRQLPTLPERFAANGFETAGFTTSLWLSAPWGGDRGFDRYASFAPEARAAANKAAVDRALDYLSSLDDRRRFFVYLQLTLGDPRLEEQLGAGGSDGSDGSAGFDRQTEVRRYDQELDDLDARLAGLFERLAESGLLAETTLVVTAAHGYELGDHGRVGHSQVYPEISRVPLVVRHPELAPGTTVTTPVQTVDLAATLAAAARLAPGPPVSGIDLAPLLAGAAPPEVGRARIASDGIRPQRALVVSENGAVTMAVETTHVAETDGAWVSRTATFDADRNDDRIEIVSFHAPRTVAVTVDGEPAGSYEVPTRWLKAPLPGAAGGTGGGLRRITLSTPECEVPARLGSSVDGRCLSFKVRGPKLTRVELFDLVADPGAATDLGNRRPRRRRELADELRRDPRLLLARPEPVPRRLWPSYDSGATR